MKYKLSLTAIAAAAALFASSMAQAQEQTNASTSVSAPSEVAPISISGFGTIGAVHNSNSNLDFTTNTRQPNGAGATRSTSFSPDSIVGVQLNGGITKNVSGVVQVVSQHQYDGTFKPSIEWAFVKWQARDNLDITFGRTALQAFATSDSRNVGYSYLWVRPPVDVYYQVPLTNIDGIGASWRHDLPVGNLTLQATGGRTNIKFPEGDKLKGRKLYNVSATLESGAFTWRAAYTSTDLTYTSSKGIGSLVSGLNQYGTGLNAAGFGPYAAEAFAAANSLNIDSRRASFVNAGVTYDKGNWIAQAEVTARKSPSYIVDTRAWHASTGYRIGTFTPYIGFSGLKTTSDPSTRTPVLSAITPTAAFLNGTMASAVASQAIAQNTSTLGVKWNFRNNMDLKLQYDHMRFKDGTNGTFTNKTGSTGNSGANLISAAVDFVF